MTDGVALRDLRLRWGAIGLCALAACALAYHRLVAWLAVTPARRWLLVAIAALGYQLGLLWAFLPRNRARGGALYRTFGPATLVTIARGLCVAFLAGFLVLPWPAGWLAWAPAALYAAVALGDYADGALARLTDRVTRLGTRLDTEIDALGILVAVAVAIRHGQLPGVFLAVGLARYAFVAGRRRRRRTGRPVHDLPPRAVGRVLAGAVMATLAYVLLPIVGPPITTAVGFAVAVPFLLGFARDWLYVTGRLG